MALKRFSVNWDYRCPFARNAHEHVVKALQGGAPFEVEFVLFSLNQAHVEEGGPRCLGTTREREPDLAGRVRSGSSCGTSSPRSSLSTHVAFVRVRHDKSADLRDKAELASVLEASGSNRLAGLRGDRKRMAAR